MLEMTSYTDCLKIFFFFFKYARIPILFILHYTYWVIYRGLGMNVTNVKSVGKEFFFGS